jgi:hypothetical protein
MTSVHPQPLLRPGQGFTSTRYCYKHFTGGLSKLKVGKTQMGPAAAIQTTHSSSLGRSALKCAGFPINNLGPHPSNVTVYGLDWWAHLRYVWCFYSDEHLVTNFRFTAKQPATRLYGVITETNTIQTIWCSVEFSYSPSRSSTAFHCCNIQRCKTVVIRVADSQPPAYQNAN